MYNIGEDINMKWTDHEYTLCVFRSLGRWIPLDIELGHYKGIGRVTGLEMKVTIELIKVLSQ